MQKTISLETEEGDRIQLINIDNEDKLLEPSVCNLSIYADTGSYVSISLSIEEIESLVNALNACREELEDM